MEIWRSQAPFLGGKWFVHISATAKPVTDSEDISNIVGLDRGLVNIVTVADQSGFTTRYSGDDASGKIQ